MKPLELAEFILSTYPDKHITPMKLQKLAYYAKAWTLIAEEDWIDAEFEKWDYGPVNNEIYQAYKSFGSNAIQANPFLSPLVGKHKSELLKFILNNYVDYSAFTLSVMTHNESPWSDTNSNQVIPDSLIKSYYSKQPFANNFSSNESDKSYHVLHSNNWHSFVLDMDEDETQKYKTYPSYEEFSTHNDKAEVEFDKLLEKIGQLTH